MDGGGSDSDFFNSVGREGSGKPGGLGGIGRGDDPNNRMRGSRLGGLDSAENETAAACEDTRGRLGDKRDAGERSGDSEGMRGMCIRDTPPRGLDEARAAGNGGGTGATSPIHELEDRSADPRVIIN